MHLHSVRSRPSSPISLTGNVSYDDNDAALQAALLASIGADEHDSAGTPALMHASRGVGDHVTAPNSDTSLAARTLQTLALDPPVLKAEVGMEQVAPVTAGMLVLVGHTSIVSAQLPGQTTECVHYKIGSE